MGKNECRAVAGGEGNAQSLRSIFSTQRRRERKGIGSFRVSRRLCVTIVELFKFINRRNLLAELVIFPYKWSDNQPVTLVVGNITPYPINKHQEFILKSNQIRDVDEEPYRPRQDVRDMEIAGEVSDCFVATDGSERTFIKVFEGVNR